MVLKWNCCVPFCSNNWRNSPNLKVHSIPSDEAVWKKYARLIRNDKLRDSSSTRICGKHFTGGGRVGRNQLPSIFPWTKEVNIRRKIEKICFAVFYIKGKNSRRRSKCLYNKDKPKGFQRWPKLLMC